MPTTEKLVSVKWDPHEIADHYYADLYWEEMLSRLKELMDTVQERAEGEYSQYIDIWFVEGSNLGWRKRNGAKVFRAKKPDELLRQILPDTVCTFTIYDEGEYLKIANYHHDAPTGESYRVHPLCRIEKGIRAEVKGMSTFGILRELMRAGSDPNVLRHTDRDDREEFLIEDRMETIIEQWKVSYC